MAMYEQAYNYEWRIKKKKWEKLREVLECSDIFIKHNGEENMSITVRRQSEMDINIRLLNKHSKRFISFISQEKFKIVGSGRTRKLGKTLECIESELKRIEKSASILTGELILEVSDFESNLRKQEWEKLRTLILKSRINVRKIEDELLVISPNRKSEIEIKIEPNAFFEESNKDFVKLEYLDCGRSLEKTTVRNLEGALLDIESKLTKAILITKTKTRKVDKL